MQNWCASDEWKNFLSRIGRDENAADSELFDSQNDILELRLWASYRGQTLARTGKIVFPSNLIYWHNCHSRFSFFHCQYSVGPCNIFLKIFCHIYMVTLSLSLTHAGTLKYKTQECVILPGLYIFRSLYTSSTIV